MTAQYFYGTKKARHFGTETACCEDGGFVTIVLVRTKTSGEKEYELRQEPLMSRHRKLFSEMQPCTANEFRTLFAMLEKTFLTSLR